MTNKESNTFDDKTVKRMEIIFDDGQKLKLDKQALICFNTEADIHVYIVGLSLTDLSEITRVLTEFVYEEGGKEY